MFSVVEIDLMDDERIIPVVLPRLYCLDIQSIEFLRKSLKRMDESGFNVLF